MNFVRNLILTTMFFSLFGLGKAASPDATFWKWFRQNDSRLFAFEKDQDHVFNSLANQLQQIDPSLTFEFGPVVGGKREFVISAGGIRSAFPAVEQLYASAPKLDHWIWVKFRPRRAPMDIRFGDVEVKSTDVFCTIQPDGEKAGLTLFIRGYRSEQDKTYQQIAYLMLDQALGEYDVETKVGFIQVKADTGESDVDKKSMKDLPKAFDDFIQSQPKK